MKKLKLIATLLVAFISFTGIYAQIDSTEKATINKSEKKVSEITYDGINYYVINGIWHIKFKNKLVLRQAPKGARITFLPKDGKMVTMGGKKYYKSNGVFYKKLKESIYEVARP
ncbi:MAG: hypothetical protein L3J20_07515 [Flavobacteriaceae bacterium]|nr:hypothetical protein [Flavobacteriaceae bacterium]